MRLRSAKDWNSNHNLFIYLQFILFCVIELASFTEARRRIDYQSLNYTIEDRLKYELDSDKHKKVCPYTSLNRCYKWWVESFYMKNKDKIRTKDLSSSEDSKKAPIDDETTKEKMLFRAPNSG